MKPPATNRVQARVIERLAETSAGVPRSEFRTRRQREEVDRLVEMGWAHIRRQGRSSVYLLGNSAGVDPAQVEAMLTRLEGLAGKVTHVLDRMTKIERKMFTIQHQLASLQPEDSPATTLAAAPAHVNPAKAGASGGRAAAIAAGRKVESNLRRAIFEAYQELAENGEAVPIPAIYHAVEYQNDVDVATFHRTLEELRAGKHLTLVEAEEDEELEDEQLALKTVRGSFYLLRWGT